jgi:hypothetical protein
MRSITFTNYHEDIVGFMSHQKRVEILPRNTVTVKLIRSSNYSGSRGNRVRHRLSNLILRGIRNSCSKKGDPLHFIVWISESRLTLDQAWLHCCFSHSTKQIRKRRSHKKTDFTVISVINCEWSTVTGISHNISRQGVEVSKTTKHWKEINNWRWNNRLCPTFVFRVHTTQHCCEEIYGILEFCQKVESKARQLPTLWVLTYSWDGVLESTTPSLRGEDLYSSLIDRFCSLFLENSSWHVLFVLSSLFLTDTQQTQEVFLRNMSCYIHTKHVIFNCNLVSFTVFLLECVGEDKKVARKRTITVQQPVKTRRTAKILQEVRESWPTRKFLTSLEKWSRVKKWSTSLSDS